MPRISPRTPVAVLPVDSRPLHKAAGRAHDVKPERYDSPEPRPLMEIDKSFPTVIVEQHNQQLRRHILWERGPLLGKGGFGSVYQGLSIATGELFAVKQVELPPDSIDARTKKVYFLNCRRSQALPMKLRS